MRVVALGAALTGGVALVAHLFVDVDVLTWIGLGLLGIAVAVVGVGLTRTWWLAVVTGLGAPALGWAVLEVARDAAPDREVEAVLGGLATLCVAVAVLRSSRQPDAPTDTPTKTTETTPRRRGNHRS